MNLKAAFIDQLDLVLLNKIIRIAALIVLILIPIDFFFTLLVNSPQHLKISTQPFVLKKTPLPPLSNYEEALQNSVLFGLAHPNGTLTVLKSSIKELTKDYRLIGIVILGEPEAIFEDARTQKNFFVKQGDKVGEVTVSKIKEESVSLSYYGEEQEVRMETKIGSNS